ncbi:hypothetical protein C8J57DRAFT_1226288 [Mycena rebaudengoi]|nr:hypothetical protein C8J57DRAFT_1226288 [Mycena rebaudengoi]
MQIRIHPPPAAAPHETPMPLQRLRAALTARKIALDEQKHGSSPPNNTNNRECSHFHTRTTPVWRRTALGALVYNTCGVYEKPRGEEKAPPFVGEEVQTADEWLLIDA